MRYFLLLVSFLLLEFTFQAQFFVPLVNMASQDEPMSEYDSLRFRTMILNYDAPQEVLKLEKMEIGIDLPTDIHTKIENFVAKAPRDTNVMINPYLEWELKVQAVFFQENSNDSIVIDGFYIKDYQSYMVSELPRPKNGEHYSDEEYNKLGGWREIEREFPFRVRFAPPATGNWNYIVRIITPKLCLKSETVSFSVIESGNKGYVKVNQNGRFLEIGNAPFYPIGLNAQWPESHLEFDPELYQYHIIKDQGKTYYRPEMYRPGICVPRVYEKYKEVLARLNDAGVNYFRTIMNPIATEIEWETVGDYTKRLSQAQEMDRILELAEERNMYIHWNMASHFTFKYNVYHITFWDWIDSDGSPSYGYKSALNLDHPTDFFRNEEAKKYYKQRLRYILSRWGYSTNVAVFELLSEISNIGSELDDNDAYYHQNHQVYEDWQQEMGTYIKSQYHGKIHLLTASYSGEMHRDDDTYFEGDTYDVMTSNIYDFGEPDFSSFFTKFVSKRFLNENPSISDENVYSMKCVDEGKKQQCNWNIKPLLFSETEPAQTLANCERSPVELNRSIWQSLFSGLAASLSWSSWHFTDNYKIYGQMNRFISDIDLGNENWHPGASKLAEKDSLRRWQYEAGFASSMNSRDKNADLAYLRSGDFSKAIGVITNKTYNIYNEDSCLVIPDFLSHLKERRTVFPTKEKLAVKGMKNDRYIIEYFLPENQNEPIFVSEQKGSTLEIDLPFLSATKEGYIVLFKVRKRP